jgi:hypothetical protein
MIYKVLVLKNQKEGRFTRYAFFLEEEKANEKIILFPGVHCNEHGKMELWNEIPEEKNIRNIGEFPAKKENLEFISREFFPDDSLEFLKKAIDKCLKDYHSSVS